MGSGAVNIMDAIAVSACRSCIAINQHGISTLYICTAPSDRSIADVRTLTYRLFPQKLYDYMYSHVQPWFKADIQAILDEPDIAALRRGRYIGMHIRRTDKLIYDGAKLTPTEVWYALKLTLM